MTTSDPDARPKMFPLIPEYMSTSKVPACGLTEIPWSVAAKAYDIYGRRYGRAQSLERLAQRGGLYPGELDQLYPAWRDETSEILQLHARIARLEKAAEPFANNPTRADLVNAPSPGRHWQCWVTADELAELRAARTAREPGVTGKGEGEQ